MTPAPAELTDRPASPEDADFLFRVYASTRAGELAALGWPPAQQEAFLRMQYDIRRQSYAAYTGAVSTVLLAHGTPAGSAIVWRTPGEIRLIDIALLPDFRSRGLGGQWIERLIREASAAQLPLRLSVLNTNPARSLYERLGFVPKSGGSMYVEMETYGTGSK
ncbi:MAG TPA: GNAT family N-acetyltransferase [Bryobacteraceae bacterium]|nr:GNAT family N-acetyltransferase [Bryobacteraceae bacterium]